MTPEEYDKGYRQWQLARLSRYDGQYVFTLKPHDLDDAKKAVKDKPNDPDAHVALALALIPAGKMPDAKRELEAALTIDPKHGDAHFVSARVAMREKDFALAERHLDTMRSQGKDGYIIHTLLAGLADAKGDKEKIRFHLEAAHRLDPSQVDPLKGLLDLAQEAKREGDELDLLRKLTALEQHDKQLWRALLEKLIAQKAWDEARRVGESAIFVDVTGGPTHVLYARALAASNAHDRAAFELETALLTKMKKEETATAHALLAQSLVALKRNADAAKHRDEALKLDPENAEAKALKL
jgi:tetratricopeptide (TPR) repeat protein